MTNRRTHVLTVLACLLAGVVIADYVVWRVATDRMLTGYARWQTRIGTQGWQVSSDPPRRAGWPLAAEIVLNRARLNQSAPGGFTWTAAQVRVGIALFRPRVVTIAPAGAETVEGPGWGPVRFAAARLVAEAPLAAQVDHARADGEMVTVTTADGPVLVAKVTVAAAWRAGESHLRLTAGPATLPAALRRGLGATVEGVTVDVGAHGAWPPGPERQAATDWRDHGGEISVNQIALHWGALAADLRGSARLDADLQPAVRLDVRVADPDAALNSLADAGVISRGAALAAGAVLSLLAPPLLAPPQQTGGAAAGIDLPLRMKHGEVLLGKIPLLTLPPVKWP